MAEQNGTSIPSDADPKGKGPPEETTRYTQLPPTPPPAYPPPPPTAKKKKTWIWVVVGVLVVAAIIGGIVGTSGKGGRDTSTPSKAFLGHWRSDYGDSYHSKDRQIYVMNDGKQSELDYIVKSEDKDAMMLVILIKAPDEKDYDEEITIQFSNDASTLEFWTKGAESLKIRKTYVDDAQDPSESPPVSRSEPEKKAEAEKPKPEPAPEPVPLPVPEPKVYSGSGDSVIAIEKPENGPAMFHISGNDSARHFSVTGYDAYDNRTSLFVNTTDPYTGFTLDPGGTTAMLEISAQGAWTVGVYSVRAARVVTSPGSISGTGDEVLQVTGSPSLATISGNPNARHFAVKGYNPSSDLLVNTTDVYTGTVRVARGTTVLEITAEGAWEITLE